MTKPETLDCLTMKSQAQRPLAKALATKSPEEQAKLLHHLAAQSPLWKGLAKARALAGREPGPGGLGQRSHR